MNGFFDNLPMDDYHADSSHSASNFMQMENINHEDAEFNKELSRKEFEKKKLKKIPKHQIVKETKVAFFEGSEIHNCLQIQSDFEKKFNERYAVAPDVRKNSTEYKTWLSNECGDRYPLSQTQADMLIGCREASRKHSEATLFLDNGKMERSGFCEIMNINVKARPDIDCMHIPASKNFPCLVDIKSRRHGEAKLWRWKKDFIKHKIFIQAGLQIIVWRKLGYDVQDYKYILIEKNPPYHVNVITLHIEWLHEVIFQVQRVLENYNKWLSDGSPKSYGLDQQMDLSERDLALIRSSA